MGRFIQDVKRVDLLNPKTKIIDMWSRCTFNFTSKSMVTHSMSRSSRLEMFCKKDVLKNFAKFTRKHLC